jgi:large subunit ribosomal protein L17
MKKRARGRKLSLEKGPREAMLRTLTNSFFMHGKIKTTEPKAREMRRIAEKMITRAKKDTVTNRRHLAMKLTQPMVKKVFVEVAPKYVDRKGGYTRIIKLNPRMSDGAKMVIIELV